LLNTVFKNLENSDLVRQQVTQRIQHWSEKFPDLAQHKITVTLEMENSSHKPGPDLFTAKVKITGEKFKHLTLEKGAATLYEAIKAVDEGMLELLNRAGDKQRVQARALERRVARQLLDM